MTQLPDTARLAKKVKRLRKRKMIWSEICRELGIYDEKGNVDTGTAYHLWEGKELSETVRARLGFRRTCTKCGRPFRTPSSNVEHVALTEAQAWWKSLPKSERDEIIEYHWTQISEGRK